MLTFGVYPIVWVGLSWAEMKRELDDPDMHPVGHALAMLVPIYGLFRLHAHFRTVNCLLAQARCASSVYPDRAVIGSIAATILSGVFWPLGAALSAWVVAHGQLGLNDYQFVNHDKET